MPRVIHRIHRLFDESKYSELRLLLVQGTQYAVVAHLAAGKIQIEPGDVDVLIEYYAPESATRSLICSTFEGLPAWNPNGRPQDLRMVDIDERIDDIGNQIISHCPWTRVWAERLQRENAMDIIYSSVGERRWRTIKVAA